ncbi:UDP-N-acetylmuramate--L-alanine ligase [Alteripontixanthobacter maritimus]|uniref:UDP-N-acetylmuramate--L-alanine ligase n=1 Tax=Alteripontixanthobacter maritimus TaxID=2161824 RepID=A0A369QAC0_9SPHN|nr:Mur ligase family protein [Alteripontixanthobacter maritimus]RDC60156.1 UDP-N-acetylmuramate--L-alanine ligase [Alteripontixanthobacter maritimus]
MTNLTDQPFFFCGIGGSGMLPLAQILKGRGAEVAGSDRSFDQGRTPAKFAALERQGFQLHPQDGSGLVSANQILVASAAVEDSVPEVVRAKELGCRRMTRAELLAALFNDAQTSVGIAGTSGKSTVTGMLGWILADADRDPTIMNGAVMKNFVTENRPFASAQVGKGDAFVSEVDESDGSIALYEPAVAVLLNVSLDHKSMDELRDLFGAFLARSGHAVVNADDKEAFALVAKAGGEVTTFGIDNGCATLVVKDGSIVDRGMEQSTIVIDRRSDKEHRLDLPVPGRHNLSNALAALAGAQAAGVSLADGVAALAQFKGLARRFEIVGRANDITVIDDFGHNPEKCAATLRTLKAQPGRVIAFFQPHGYGPLRQMGRELAETFAAELGTDDVTILCDPVYFGGTVDRSEGSERIVTLIREAGGTTEYIPSRAASGDRMVELAQPDDRIVIMGARDDTLSAFAKGVLERL